MVRNVSAYNVDVLVRGSCGLEVRGAHVADDGKHDRVRLLCLIVRAFRFQVVSRNNRRGKLTSC